LKLAEEHQRRLHEHSEEQLRTITESNQQLQEQVKKYAASKVHLEGMLGKCSKGLETVLPVLEEVRRSLSSVSCLNQNYGCED
jgi:hypothetical protein